MIDMNDIYNRYRESASPYESLYGETGEGVRRKVRELTEPAMQARMQLYGQPTQATDQTQPFDWGQFDWGQEEQYPQEGGFQYPSQWGGAEAYYQKLLGGYMPEAWQTGQDVLTGMARGGQPVDVSGLYGAQEAVGQRALGRYAQEQAEKMGVGGKRWSTPLQARITEYSGQLAENLAAQQAQAEIQAQEAARQRQLAATGQLYQYGMGPQELQMQAAQGMTGLGSLYAQLPMDVAQQMQQMELGMQQSQMGELGPVYNEFQRMAAENNPYLKLGMQYLGQQPGMVPQTYQPSWLTQGLGLSGQMFANPQIMQMLQTLLGGGGGQQQGGGLSWLQNLMPGAFGGQF